MLAFAAYIYPGMHDPMYSHWNFRAALDGLTSKFWGMFLFPLVAAEIYILYLLISRIAPFREKINEFRCYYDWLFGLLIGFCGYFYLLTVISNMGVLYVSRFLPPAYGVLAYYTGSLIKNVKKDVFGGRLLKTTGIVIFAGTVCRKYAFDIVWISIFAAIAIVFLHSYFLNKTKKWRNLAFCFFAVCALVSPYVLRNNNIKIGVMLPLSGPKAIESAATLNWAAEKINSSGGVNGKDIELAYRDTNIENPREIAEEFIQNPAIQIVIGPGDSDQLLEIGPLFIEAGKILISPTSTADTISRAFAGKQHIWRTTQSDIAQIRAIFDLLESRGAKKVALIYDDSIYGETFYNWFGFFATETGMEVIALLKVDEDLTKADEAEYIICAVFPKEAVRIVREIDNINSPAKLFFTDAAQSRYLIAQLGEKALGLEFSSPAADPDSGYEEAYKRTFDHYPLDFSAPTYDALLLAVFAQARHEYVLSKYKWESFITSFTRVAHGDGEEVNWHEPEKAIALIFKGELPSIKGAGGRINYDKKKGVDLTESFYSFSRIENKDQPKFRTFSRVSSSESLEHGILGKGRIATETKASDKYLQKTDKVTELVFKEKKDLWAIIISASKGWKDYRHHADVLGVYDILKRNGVPEEKIVLMVYDDIAYNRLNLKRGDIHNEIKGKNLYKDAEIDYREQDINPEKLEDILLGLDSDEHSNVLLYISAHGGHQKIGFPKTEWTADQFLKTIEEMHTRKKFRQMLIVIDSCYGESMAIDLNTPGVLYLTGAGEFEPGFAHQFDIRILAWINDQFSHAFFQNASQRQGLGIYDFYKKLYQSVSGSHVRIKNYKNSGQAEASIDDFTS